LSDLEKAETTETILGVRASGDEDRWHFSGDVSEMWVYTLSEHWPERVYSEYYTDFWQDVLDKLDLIKHPVEISLRMLYDFGMTTEEEVQAYLADHKTGTAFLVMHREEDDSAQMSCAWMLSYEIKELEPLQPSQAERGDKPPV